MIAAATESRAILVADGQALFGEALACALSDQHGLEVVPEYPDRGLAALDAIRRLRPGVVVYDYWLLGVGGPAAADVIRASVPGTKVLLTSWCHSTQHIRDALDAGAAGFLPKSLSVAQVAEAVRRAASGDALVFAEQLAGLVDNLDGRLHASFLHHTGLASLSHREVEVLRGLADGATLLELSDELSLSVGTLKNHVHKILVKTGASTQLEAVAMARHELFITGGGQRRRAPAGDGSDEALTDGTGPRARSRRRSRGDRVSVLVADTQLLFADSVQAALARDPRLSVLPELPTHAAEAIDLVTRLRPDVVLYDLYLRDMQATAAVRALARWTPRTRVVLASWYHARPHVRRALASQPGVIVPKHAGVEALADTVHAAGRRDASAHAALVRDALDVLDGGHGPDDRLFRLGPRELQVLHLLARGYTMNQVAGELCLAAGTVKNLTSNLKAKLGVRTQLQAVTAARDGGFVE